MTRVHVICEGQTEETFVTEILAPEFTNKGIYLFPSLIGKPGHKGGNFKFQRLLTDVRARLADRTAYCTTFFDFYGLPEDFPGKTQAKTRNGISDKAAHLSNMLNTRLKAELGAAPSKRILQLIQSYEKPVYGALAALEIGLDDIRRECVLFNQWIQKLETLPALE